MCFFSMHSIVYMCILLCVNHVHVHVHVWYGLGTVYSVQCTHMMKVPDSVHTHTHTHTCMGKCMCIK